MEFPTEGRESSSAGNVTEEATDRKECTMKPFPIRTLITLMTRVKSIRIFRFGAIGALGAVVNVGLMAALVMLGLEYLVAAVIATEATIISNFICQERWVFNGPESHNGSTGTRFLRSFTFNNAETLIRMPALWLLVDRIGIASPVAQFETLVVAFVGRYVFHSRMIYSPSESERSPDSLGPP